MSGEADFRARWEARCIEAMARGMFYDSKAWEHTGSLTKEIYMNKAHAAFRAFQDAMWMDISEAPKEGLDNILLALTGPHDPISEMFHNKPTHAIPLPLAPKGGEGE